MNGEVVMNAANFADAGLVDAVAVIVRAVAGIRVAGAYYGHDPLSWVIFEWQKTSVIQEFTTSKVWLNNISCKNQYLFILSC